MLNKIILFFQIRKFYKLFGSEVGNSFINKVSDMTADNVHDVIFDVDQICCYYELEYDEYKMTAWLYSLRRKVINFCCKRGVM